MPLLGRRLVTLAWAGKIPYESQKLTGSQKLLRIWNEACGMQAFGGIAGFDVGDAREIKSCESPEPPVCSGVPRCYKNGTRSGGGIWASAYLARRSE